MHSRILGWYVLISMSPITGNGLLNSICLQQYSLKLLAIEIRVCQICLWLGSYSDIIIDKQPSSGQSCDDTIAFLGMYRDKTTMKTAI